LAALADWQLSAADFAEWFGPVAFLLAALLSAWVLHDARRRAKRYALALAFALALLTLALPPVVFPLYLAARLLFPRKEPEHDEGREAEAEGVEEAEAEGVEATPRQRPKRLGLPLAYALVLVAAGAFFFARDYRSFEARLARARSANLRGRHASAVEEYRAALRLREDAHTRKLLGLELLEAGRRDEASVELRAAARAGEPDVPEVQTAGGEAR